MFLRIVIIRRFFQFNIQISQHLIQILTNLLSVIPNLDLSNYGMMCEHTVHMLKQYIYLFFSDTCLTVGEPHEQ